MKLLPEPVDFEWDRGNIDKNYKKHGITRDEAEQVFINNPVYFFEDKKHSKHEKRYGVFGITTTGKKLFIVYTFRNSKIRIINARSLSRKERKVYEEKIKANPNI